MKTKINKFGANVNLFLNYLIYALNEYLGDLTCDQNNKYLKDKSNYFNYFLSIVSDYIHFLDHQ